MHGSFFYKLVFIFFKMPEMKNAMESALKSSFSKGIEVLVLQACGVTCGLGIMILMARYGGEISLK